MNYARWESLRAEHVLGVSRKVDGVSEGAGEPEGVVGLRERKKAATRLALHEAAVRLAVERGIDGLTVDAIADGAMVSRRTFSNYFAGKEKALLYGDQRRLNQLLDAVRARPAREKVWPALTKAAAEVAAERMRDDPHELARYRMLVRHPALLSEQVAMHAAAEHDLADEISGRLPAGPDHTLRARLLAATLLTTFRVAIQMWLDEPETSLTDLVDRSFATVGSRFR